MKRSFCKKAVPRISALLAIILILTNVSVIAVNPEYYANITQISDTEYKLTGVADTSKTNTVTFTVYNPGYSADSLTENSPANNLKALAHFGDFQCEADGSFEHTFKLSPGKEGEYTICFGDAGEAIEPITVRYDSSVAENDISVNLTFDGVTDPETVVDIAGADAVYQIEDNKLSVHIPKDGNRYSRFEKVLDTSAKAGVYRLAFDYLPNDLNYSVHIHTFDTSGFESELFVLNGEGKKGIIPATDGYEIYNKFDYTAGSSIHTELYIDMDARRLYYVEGGTLKDETSLDEGGTDIKKLRFNVNRKATVDAEPQAVFFDNIVFEKVKTNTGLITPISDNVFVTATGGIRGNIFTDTLKPVFDIDAKTRYSTGKNISRLKVYAYDDSNAEVYRKEISVAVPSANVNKVVAFENELKYGLYTIKVEAYDESNGLLGGGTEEFSVVNAPGTLSDNKKTGISAHFLNSDELTMLEPTGESGLGIIRVDCRWIDCEKTSGKYEIPNSIQKVIDYANENGLDVMLILGSANSLYGNGAIPFDSDELAAYGNFCSWIANETRGKVKYFEPWNEFNQAKNSANRDIYTAKEFYNILKTAYGNIKTVNPEAVVFLGGMRRVYETKYLLWEVLNEDYEFLNSVFDEINNDGEMGKGVYASGVFDAISIHPYRLTDAAPENTEFVETMQAFKTYIEKKGYGDKPIWISEIGLPSSSYTEADQARYMIRMLALNDMHSLAERTIWYNLENNGVDAEHQEHNFGLVKSKQHTTPSAAKAGYLVMANYNTQTNGAKLVNGVVDTNGAYKVEYKISDGVSRYILWKASGTAEVSFDVIDKICRVRDMYGNVIATVTGETTYNVSAGKNPVYVEISDMFYSEIVGDNIKINFVIPDTIYNEDIFACVAKKRNDVLVECMTATGFIRQGNTYTSSVTMKNEDDITVYVWEDLDNTKPLTKNIHLTQ